jgi:hypothetical protein
MKSAVRAEPVEAHLRAIVLIEISANAFRQAQRERASSVFPYGSTKQDAIFMGTSSLEWSKNRMNTAQTLLE